MVTDFKATNPDYAGAVRESFGRQGLMRTLGARILTIEPGLCVIEMPYAPGVSQQQGYFHGGAIGAIADIPKSSPSNTRST
jgi:acyl-coenzyme A thioesterase PaaI-like protein